MDICKSESESRIVEGSHAETDDRVAEMSYLEIRIAELQAEEDEATESESFVQPHPLSAFLPPFIFTSHLSAAQKVLQPFPYNMSTSNGIIAWSITVFTAAAFCLAQNWALHHFDLCRLGESRAMIAIYLVVLVIEFFVGVCSSLYPLAYGCVLRWTDGVWPRKEKVWGSEGEWDAMVGFTDFENGQEFSMKVGAIAQYTLIGILVVGIWNVLRGEGVEGKKERCGFEQDEKLRLLEEGEQEREKTDE